VTSCSDIGTSLTPPGFGTTDPPDMTLIEPGDPPPIEIVQPEPNQPISDWIPSPCSEARYRFLASGHVEVQGRGVPRAKPWPKPVNDWRHLIEESASANGVSPALLAAIVATQSGGDAAKMDGDRYGLLQLDIEMAQLISGAKVEPDTVLHPAWNLMFGGKLVAKCLNETDNNLIAAIAMYSSGSVRCDTECELDKKWGVWSKCGYVDSVISHMNTAVDSGYTGTMFIDLGEGDAPKEDSSLWLGMAALGLIAAGVYGFTRLGKGPRK